MPKYAILGLLALLLWFAYVFLAGLFERIKDGVRGRTNRVAEEWRAKQWRGWIED